MLTADRWNQSLGILNRESGIGKKFTPEDKTMIYLILIYGALTCIAGIAISIKPDAIFGFIGARSESLGVHVLAIVVRLVLGAALLSYSAASKFPLTFQVLGWLTLVAAIIMALLGRTRFKTLIAWAVRVPSLYKRIGGFIAMLFGGFLFYAVL